MNSSWPNPQVPFVWKGNEVKLVSYLYLPAGGGDTVSKSSIGTRVGGWQILLSVPLMPATPYAWQLFCPHLQQMYFGNC